MHTHTPHIRPLTRAAFLGASLLLLSCTKTEISQQESGDGAITFTNVGTKAPVESFKAGDSFSVWGWRETGNAQYAVFDATEVSTADGTDWGYSGLQYWLPSSTYSFYALYPAVQNLKEGTSATCTQDGTITVRGFDASITGPDAVDLMTATRTGMSGDRPQTVAFTFRHELSRLSFKVQADNITVTAAALYGVYSKGDFSGSITDVSWQSSWNGLIPTSEEDTPFKLGESPEFSNNAAIIFEDIMLPPHTEDALSNAALAITYYISGAPAQSQTVIFNLSDAPVKEWTAGSSYSYTATISADLNLTVSVEDWTDGGDHSVSW